MHIIVVTLLILIALWTLFSYLAVRNIEEPRYTVTSSTDVYEIRQYDSYIVAETYVSGEYRSALNQGFRNIANYIFGDNTKTEKIAMTAPVLENKEQESVSEKIAMTVPVLAEGDSAGRVVSFVMPSKYTIDTLPKPNKDNVTIRDVPAKKRAVLSYTWYTNESRNTKMGARLKSALEADGVQLSGDVISARYNPPLTIPFLLRNEVMIVVE